MDPFSAALLIGQVINSIVIPGIVNIRTIIRHKDGEIEVGADEQGNIEIKITKHLAGAMANNEAIAKWRAEHGIVLPPPPTPIP